MFGVVVGAAAFAAAGITSYGALSPSSQLFGRALSRGPKPRQLALTYDDGPNDSCTPQLLEILARHEVKATFFLIGRYVRQSPQLAQQIAQAGHAIGNHTFHHPNLFFCSERKIKEELVQCELAFNDAIGDHPRLFRPPWGARRPAVVRAARALGLEPILWSVTCYDWRPTSAERVLKHATRQITPRHGEIILLHDGGHKTMGADRVHTLKATDELIRRYKGEGFEFATVPQMLADAR